MKFDHAIHSMCSIEQFWQKYRRCKNKFRNICAFLPFLQCSTHMYNYFATLKMIKCILIKFPIKIVDIRQSWLEKLCGDFLFVTNMHLMFTTHTGMWYLHCTTEKKLILWCLRYTRVTTYLIRTTHKARNYLIQQNSDVSDDLRNYWSVSSVRHVSFVCVVFYTPFENFTLTCIFRRHQL